MGKFSVNDIRAVAVKHQEKTKKKKEVSSAKTELAAVSSESLLGGLLGVPEGPIVSPVVFSKKVPATHPVRNKDFHVCLFTSQNWKTYYEFNSLAHGAQTLAQKAETDEEKTAHEDSVRKINLSRFMFVIRACLCDKDGNLLLKDTTEESILEEYFQSPARAQVYDELWTAAMSFNGLLLAESKEEAKN